jgi:uncharacterized protein YndB with AHSA1/START domain
VTAKIAVSIRLAVEPAAAFDLFTRDVDRWWQKGQRYRFRAGKAGRMAFEPGVGGRLVEIYDEAAGDLFEVGRISIWQPGERLAFTWRLPNFQPDQLTEVEITFTAVQGGTRLTLEHRGWNSLPPDHPARHDLRDQRFLVQCAQWWDDQFAALQCLFAQGP